MASVTFCRVPGVGGAYGAERLLVRASGLVGAYRVAARLSEHAADAYRLRASISAKRGVQSVLGCFERLTETASSLCRVAKVVAEVGRVQR